MEDDTLNLEADAFPTPDSNQENGPAKRKGRQGKATAKKFTKPKVRRSGDGVTKSQAVPKAKTGRKRAPLKEQTNVQHAEDTEEVDEFDGQQNEDTVMDELVEPKQQVKRKAPERKVGRPPKRNAKKDGEFEYTPTIARQTKGMKNPTATKASKAQQANMNKRHLEEEPPNQERIIPETQVPKDAEPSEVPEGDEDEDAVPQSVFRRTNNAREPGRLNQPSLTRKRAGSASDTERAGNDPATRRKLGEMTRKFDNLDLKYKTLKETVAKEASINSQNFEAKLQNRSKGNSIANMISTS